MIPPGQMEVVSDFIPFGVHAFTTMRQVGSFGTASAEPVNDVMGRWSALRETIASRGVRRLATAAQVHGTHVVEHQRGWEGWLRGNNADGHVSLERGTAMAVTIADCVPVFVVHPNGAAAVLHSGWRGTAARIVEQGIGAFTRAGLAAADLHIHLGPAICGKCYEVSPDVIRQVSGESVPAPRPIDLRAIIATHARAMGVHQVSISPSCTRCNNDRFFSHRAGDAGRQLGVIVTAS